MIMNVSWRRLALGIAGAIALATSSQAAPVLSSTAGLKAAVSDHATEVRWRRGGVAAGIAAGVLAGAVIGAATAPYYYGGYGYPGYAYSYPAYGYPPSAYGAYAYSPGYYGAGYGSYAYPTQTCGVYGGYGRWDYSQC